MEDLGQIEFLRNHPMILDRLKELSVDGTLDGFIKNECATEFDGGFTWGKSKEGFDFWHIILAKKKPEHFYTLYPKTLKQDTSLRDEITNILYRNSTDDSECMRIRFEDIQNVIGLLSDAMLIERLK